MYLIVGLGNPGDKYKNNRHNVGFMFVNSINKSGEWTESKSSEAEYCWINLNENEIELFKPMAFMNRSGLPILQGFKKHRLLKPENLYVVHDDLDIPLGKFRIDMGRGSRLHNGIKSIESVLKTKDFWRVRIGVDNRQQTGPMDGESYVLKNFLPDERELIDNLFPTIYSRLSAFFK